MRSIVRRFPLVSLVVSLAAGVSVPAATACAESGATVVSNPAESVPGEFLVRFADDVAQARIDEINARFGVEVVDRLLDGKVLLIRVRDPAMAADIMALYAATPGVLYAEPNYAVSIPEGANDGPRIQ